MRTSLGKEGKEDRIQMLITLSMMKDKHDRRSSKKRGHNTAAPKALERRNEVHSKRQISTWARGPQSCRIMLCFGKEASSVPVRKLHAKSLTQALQIVPAKDIKRCAVPEPSEFSFLACCCRCAWRINAGLASPIIHTRGHIQAHASLPIFSLLKRVGFTLTCCSGT